MNRIVINADLGEQTISRHLYGHFAEHLGRCIYDGLWVGEDSPVPNVRGIRADIVAALRKIKVPNLRWPGGCFADAYHWRDGIGPKAQRPHRINQFWGEVIETNAFGTHEFLDLCALLECEPYICGNVGSGTVQEMRDWVEYLTASGESALAAERRANGRAEPWPVKFWGVGNENWGCGGYMRPEYYVDLYRRFQTFLRSYNGQPLYKIASGMGGSDVRSTEVLMRDGGCERDGHSFDAISLHYYCFFPQTDFSATQFGEDQWFKVLQAALAIEPLLARHIAIMDRYDPARKVGMIVDEWGAWYPVEPGTPSYELYQQNSLCDALVAGVTLHVFHEHAERVRMANIAQTVNVLQAMILTEGEQMLLTPTYHVFELFTVHHDATRLPLHLDAPSYTFGDESLPAVSASASRNEAGQVHVSLCNLDPHADLDLRIELRGMTASGVSGRVLTADRINAHNTFAQPETVKPAPFDGARLEQGALAVRLPAKSVVVLAVEN
ncbi:MAG: alpha-N-arabinofuranosidase [Anaerolineae bacterium]|nr:alpha-N-arabinofuranosidase [Anaerolineae bacterium]